MIGIIKDTIYILVNSKINLLKSFS